MDNESRVRNYRDLLVWQKGIALSKSVYCLTKAYPTEERFGLTSQMRRASISIPSNIAEGQARKTTGEFLQFLSIAKGSLAELDTQVVLSIELGFATQAQSDDIQQLILELNKMLSSLQSKLTTNH